MSHMQTFGATRAAHHDYSSSGPDFGSSMVTSSDGNRPLFDSETGKPITQQYHFEQLQKYLGVPTKEVRQSPYSSMSTETRALPEAFVGGDNGYLSSIIITNITTAEQTYIREMTPVLRHEDSLTIAWDRMIFNDHQLDRVPNEAVPRLITSKREAFSQSMVRHGLAMLLEWDFYRTPVGRRAYSMHLKQISNAIIETMCLAAVVKVFTVTGSTPLNDNSSARASLIELETRFRDEFAQWGALQRESGGFEMAVQRADRALTNKTGSKGDYFLFPQGSEAYAQGTLKENFFLFSGRKTGDERDVVASAMGGRKFRESRKFRGSDAAGSRNGVDDPAMREQTIGTFFTMDNTSIENVEPSKFRTQKMDRVIYCETPDAYCQLSFADSFGNAGLFEGWHEDNDDKDMPLSDIGLAFFGDHETWGSYIRAADPHGYCMETLVAKDVSHHNSLLEKVAEKLARIQAGAADNVTADSLQAQFFADDDVDNPNRVQGRMTVSRHHQGGNHGGQAHTGSGMSQHHSVTAQQALDAVVQTSWSESDQKFVYGLAKWIEKRQRQQPRLAAGFEIIVKAAQQYGDETEDIDVQSVVLSNLSQLFLTCDLIESTDAIVSGLRSGQEPTELEAALHTLRNRSLTDRNAMETIRRADRVSPAWQPLRARASAPIFLWTSPGDADAHMTQLYARSFSYTLASDHVVLFYVDENVEEELANQGMALSNEGAVGSRPGRDGMLQLSVTVSAVYSAVNTYVEQMLEQGDDAESDAGVKALIQRVRKLVKKEGAVSGFSNALSQAARRANGLKSPVLMCQQWASSIIAECLKMITALVTNSRACSDNDCRNWVHAIGDAIFESRVGASPQQNGGMMGAGMKQIDAAARKRIQARGGDVRESHIPQLIAAEKEAADIELERFHGMPGIAPPANSHRLDVFAVHHAKLQELVMLIGYNRDLLGLKAQDDYDNVLKIFLTRAQQLQQNAGKNAARAGASFIHPWIPIRAMIELALGALHEVDESGLAGPFTDLRAATGLLLSAEDAPSKKKVLAKIAERVKDANDKMAKSASEATNARIGPIESAKLLREELLSDEVVNRKGSASLEALKTRISGNNAKAPTVVQIQPVLKSALTETFSQDEDDDDLIKGAVANGMARYVLGQSLIVIQPISAQSLPSAVENWRAQRIADGVLTLLQNNVVSLRVRNQMAASDLPTSPFNDEAEAVVEKLIVSLGTNNGTKLSVAVNSLMRVNGIAAQDDAGDEDSESTATKFSATRLWAILDHLPITGDFAKWALHHHVYVPVQLLCLRPHMQYEMGSAAVLKGGGATGNVFYARPDFQIGQNTAQKMIWGNYTQEQAAVITEPSNIVILPNILTTQYLGGYDKAQWDPLDAGDVDAYNQDELDNSMFVIPERPNVRFDTTVLDILGYHSPDMRASVQASESTRYTMSNVIPKIWKWEKSRSSAGANNYASKAEQGRFNHRCARDFNRAWNEAKGDFEREQVNRGHHGSHGIYPGAGAVRNGSVKHYRTAQTTISIQ